MIERKEEKKKTRRKKSLQRKRLKLRAIIRQRWLQNQRWNHQAVAFGEGRHFKEKRAEPRRVRIEAGIGHHHAMDILYCYNCVISCSSY